MQVSPKKRAANRRNALKSTGPKTGPGRRVSAQNSVRHGLSVQLPLHINDPLQNELTQLIEHDGIASDVAEDLALKIINYERNVMYLYELFKKEVLGSKSDSEEKKSVYYAEEMSREELEDFVASINKTEFSGMDPILSKMECLRIRVATKHLKNAIQSKKAELDNSRRYFKRSSNQLIKALRKL